jgi:DNA-binding transcriptional LysR family regulator
MPGMSTSDNSVRLLGIRFAKSKGQEFLVAVLAGGRAVAVPMSLYPTLEGAPASMRNDWRLIGRGHGVHWPKLDLDLSAAGIVAAIPDRTRQTRNDTSTHKSMVYLTALLARSAADQHKSGSNDEIVDVLRQFPPARLRAIWRGVAPKQRKLRR